MVGTFFLELPPSAPETAAALRQVVWGRSATGFDLLRAMPRLKARFCYYSGEHTMEFP